MRFFAAPWLLALSHTADANFNWTISSEPEDCAPEGWADQDGVTCETYLLSDYCSEDYTAFATDGYHGGQCAECGCVKLAEKPAAHPCDQASNGGCDQSCKKDGDNAICECGEGWTLNGDGKSCESGAAKAAATDNGPCPSEECWSWNTVTSECDLKASSSGCDYSVTCSHDTGMEVTMNNALFGSVKTSDFNDPNGAACNPAWSTSSKKFEWTQPLGACGQTLKRENDHIIFTKTLTLGSNSDDGIEVGTSGITLFTSAESHGVSVTFKCKFATSATATSAELGVKRRVAVSGTAAEATGIWDESMTLKYFTDDGFTTEMDSSAHSVFIGATMFVRSSWTVTTLANSLRYYISRCTVKDKSDGTKVAIVDGTCFASAVGAEPLGPAAVDSATGKIVKRNSDFKYKSFSFGSNGAGKQELECTVNFCIVQYPSYGGHDGGQTDCPDVSHLSGGKTCPTTTGFGFIPGPN